MEDFSAVNWLAVGVGVVVSFLAGWFWYSPKVFGKNWAAGVGIKLDENTKPPFYAFVAQLSALFILATIIGVTATSDALITAILVIVCTLAFIISSGTFINKSLNSLLIEAGYILVCGVIMITCQAII